MNRRSFLIFTAATAASATIASATNVAAATTTIIKQSIAPRRRQVLEAAPIKAWEIPPFPCREIIRQASRKELMLWWAKYGAGSQAGFWRGVPRKYVRFWLLHYHGVRAPEKFYG